MESRIIRGNPHDGIHPVSLMKRRWPCLWYRFAHEMNITNVFPAPADTEIYFYMSFCVCLLLGSCQWKEECSWMVWQGRWSCGGRLGKKINDKWMPICVDCHGSRIVTAYRPRTKPLKQQNSSRPLNPYVVLLTFDPFRRHIALKWHQLEKVFSAALFRPHKFCDSGSFGSHEYIRNSTFLRKFCGNSYSIN